jgi:hypothetical protein
MISKTFGAPFGGTTRGGHHGVDSEAFSLITPPNFGSAGGDRRRSLGRTRNARDLLSRYRNATEGEKNRPCKQGTTDCHGENPHAELLRS